METVKIRDEYIKLGQLLKLSGLVSSGVEAKVYIHNGEVSVNGNIVTERGKKIYPGDTVHFAGQDVKVEK